MKLNELTHGVPKGSQTRYKHPFGTDDPKKYVGRWEEYTTPQGIGRVKKKKKKVKEGDAMERLRVMAPKGAGLPRLFTLAAAVNPSDNGKVVQFRQRQSGNLVGVVQGQTVSYKVVLKPGGAVAYGLMDHEGNVRDWKAGRLWRDDKVWLRQPHMTESDTTQQTQFVWNDVTKKDRFGKATEVGMHVFLGQYSANITFVKAGHKGNVWNLICNIGGVIGRIGRINMLDAILEFVAVYDPDLLLISRDEGSGNLVKQIIQPFAHRIERELAPMKYKLVANETSAAIVYTEIKEDSGLTWTRRDTPAQGTVAVELYQTDKRAQNASKKAPLRAVKKAVRALAAPLSPKLAETVRKPQFGILNRDYEVQDPQGKVLGVCVINDNVIERLEVQDGTQEGFLGQVLQNLLQAVVREANRVGAPLRMQMRPGSHGDLKRFLERFGFRHVGDNVMKRQAGSVIPPSVILTSGIDGNPDTP